MDNESKKLSRLNEAARKLSVPVLWLKEEADSDQIPHLNAGGILLFNVEAVRVSLAKRATNPNPQERSHAKD